MDSSAARQDCAFAGIEAVIGQSVRRNIDRMRRHAAGALEQSARSIMRTPDAHVGIVTGFFIRHAEPPSPETDGLGGMAHLAAGIANVGIPVTVITDEPCANAVRAVAATLPSAVRVEVVAVSTAEVLALRARLENAPRSLTHLIAIERVAPGSDGKPHREHGWDMSADTAPLHLLFEDKGWTRPWVTIGIGDGGNEIGMGALPAHLVAEDIPNGALVASTVSADHLIVAGVSTWGGYGLLAAMAMAAPERAQALLKDFSATMDYSYLSAAVHIGRAVDDSRPEHPARPVMSVDCLPWERHAALLAEVKMLAESHITRLAAARPNTLSKPA
jgi:hypothetical protein